MSAVWREGVRLSVGGGSVLLPPLPFMPGGAVSARGTHSVRILGLLCGCVCVVVVSVCHPGRGHVLPFGVPLLPPCHSKKGSRRFQKFLPGCWGGVWLVFVGFVVAWGRGVVVVLVLCGSSQFVAVLLVLGWRCLLVLWADRLAV